MHRTPLYAASAACLILVLAACGGGGGGSTIPSASPTPKATSTPAPLPTPAAATNTQSVSLSTTAATTAVLPATGGITPTVTIPQASSGTGAVSVTVATGSLATMQRARESALARRMAMAGGPYLLQLDFVPTQTVTLSGAPGFSLDLTQYVTSAGLSLSDAATYLQNEGVYIGVMDDAGNFNVAGPITIASTGSALTATYTGTATSITLTASEHYTIGIHLGPIAAATSSPTPSPTPTATPTPTPAATATPTPTPTASPTPFASPSISLFQLGSIYGGGAIAQGITADSHGIVWFAENPGTINNGDGFISTIDAAGTVTTFPYTPTNQPTHPSGVAFGPDGNLWATENCAGADMDVFSSTGSYVRSYLFYGSSSTLCGGSWTNQLISGTDGNLWFAEGSQAVGKFTTSGAITQYTLPNPGYTVGVTNGPNGEVWFAEQVSGGSGNVNAGGVLGKVTSTGQVVTYPLNSGEVPGGLTLGTDGNIWFTYGTQSTTTGIGKMTSSGVETDYTPSTTGQWGGASEAIVSGPDGKIWSGGDGVLMTIDPKSGTIATYPTSVTGCYGLAPLAMVSVPATNSIWFTASGCIGEVVLH